MVRGFWSTLVSRVFACPPPFRCLSIALKSRFFAIRLFRFYVARFILQESGRRMSQSRAHGNTVVRRAGPVWVRRCPGVARIRGPVCICARGRNLRSILLFLFSPSLPPPVLVRPFAARPDICALDTQNANNSPLAVGRMAILHFGRELTELRKWEK